MSKPDLNMINHYISPFKCYVQKVLPAVYDDSLSYYELLSKVIEQLNQMGVHVNNLTELWNEVNEWLVNEGLHESVSNKLDEMYAEGQLDDLIDGVLDNVKANMESVRINVLYPPIGIEPADPSGITESSTTIQACIDYVESLGGGTVIIPKGDYLINKGLMIRKSYVTLEGSGHPRLFTKGVSETDYQAILRILQKDRENGTSSSSIEHVIVKGLHIDGISNVNGIIATGLARGCHFTNLKITNCNDGFALAGAWQFNIDNNNIQYCYRGVNFATSDYGGYVQPSETWTNVNNITFASNVMRDCTIGLYWRAGINNTIISNAFELNNVNFRAWKLSGSLISGNAFEKASSNYAGELGGDSTDNESIDNVFSNNFIFNPTTKLGFAIKNVKRTLFVGNRYDGDLTSNLYAKNSDGDASNNMDNIFMDCVPTGISTFTNTVIKPNNEHHQQGNLVIKGSSISQRTKSDRGIRTSYLNDIVWNGSSTLTLRFASRGNTSSVNGHAKIQLMFNAKLSDLGYYKELYVYSGAPNNSNHTLTMSEIAASSSNIGVTITKQVITEGSTNYYELKLTRTDSSTSALFGNIIVEGEYNYVLEEMVIS